MNTRWTFAWTVLGIAAAIWYTIMMYVYRNGPYVSTGTAVLHNWPILAACAIGLLKSCILMVNHERNWRMSKKPVGVLILGWLFLALAALKLIGLLMVLGNDNAYDLKPIVFIVQIVSIPLYFAIGMGLLLGKNWSRNLYLGVGIASFGFGIVLGGLNALVAARALVFGIIVFYLFRPRVTSFFMRDKSPARK